MSGFPSRFLVAASTALLLAACHTSARAQEPPEEEKPDFGEYNPNRGFLVARSDRGELSARFFTYIRYLNQKGLDPTYTDTFGQTTTLDRRQDIQFQKVTLNFYGWIMDPKLRYLLYAWTANTSQGQGAQVVIGGNMNYRFNPRLTLGGGIDALPGVRATEGNFPFWLTVDNRLIADEYFRPSYTMGIWARGEVVDRLTYRLMLGNNLSQLGVDAGELDDGLNTVSAGLIWLPTTGEFGTGGGFGDFDTHEDVATRLAAHFTTSDENFQAQPNTDLFENVQIRLSDGNSIFEPNLFGPGIQIEDATYHMFCTDGGIKYRGFSLDGEFYWRWVDNFRGPGVGTLAFDEISDNGFQLQASAMVMPSVLQAYTGYSKVISDNGDPWDLRFGLNWHPWHNHVVRWNYEYLYTHRSPVGGLSLPTQVGGTGEIFYTSFQINF